MIALLFIFLQVLCVSIVAGSNSISTIAWSGLFQLIISVLYIIKIQGEKMSVSIFFIIFSFILHLGQYMLSIFDTGVTPSVDITKKVSEGILISTGQYIIYAHVCLSIGIVLYLIKIKNISIRIGKLGRNNYDKKIELNNSILKIIAYIMLLIGLPLSVQMNYTLIRLMMVGGYYNTFGYYSNNNGIKTQLANMWILGIIILLFLNSEKKKRCRLLLGCSLIYLFATMLTGGRIMAMMNTVTIVFFYFRIIEKPKGVKTVLLATVGLVLVEYIVNIGLSRASGFGVSLEFGTSIKELVGEVLAEFGGTSYSLALLIEHVPKDINYAFGVTYPLSLIYVLPNFGWASWEIISTTVFTDYLRPYTNSGIGGTYIGEAYFNAGYLGLLFIFLFGLFLGWYDTKIRKYLKQENWLKLLAYIGTMPYLLMITRSFIKDVVRPFVWILIAVTVLYHIFTRNKTKIKKSFNYYDKGD